MSCQIGLVLIQLWVTRDILCPKKKHQYFEQIGLVNLDYTYIQHQIYRHIYLNIHVYKYIHTYIHTYIHIYKYVTSIHYIYIYIHEYKHKCKTHMYMIYTRYTVYVIPHLPGEGC